MALNLYLHPLSSYCHKVLIAFYENDIPFERKLIDAAAFDGLKQRWPLGKFPVLEDDARDEVIPESTIIIEYLALHYPGRVRLIPETPDRARRVRFWDRFFDGYLHTPMQKCPADRLRPAEHRDAYGVREALALYRSALGMVEAHMADKTWAMGDEFTLADCAAAPALFYGEHFYGPFSATHPHAMAYLDRLKSRPSYARVLEEAKPYVHMLPV